MTARIAPPITLAILLTGCGGSSSPSAPSAAAASRAPVQIKVMTFNIQHGIDGKNRYNLQSAIDTIARVQPDIVGLQEVARQNASYNCDDEAPLIAAGVTTATGQPWTPLFEQEWFTQERTCESTGRGSGAATEGLAFISRRGIGNPAKLPLADSRLGYEVPIREAYNLPILVTHLVSGGSGNAGIRAQEVSQLMGWAASFGEPRILMGDFNARSEDPELQPVITTYHDAWTDALKAGRAIGSGPSHGNARIDFIFYMPGAGLTLDAAEVVDTVPLIGIEASDHRPLVATFTVR
jgi:endonuclease/exonuclease/phosphatase family metal-dependent hydrolase